MSHAGSSKPTPLPSPDRPSPGAALRIVGMVVGRNEAPRLPFCLRALSRYADAIVYLDDRSTDDSVAVVQSLAAECRIERILAKTNSWCLDEPGDRNLMLAAGREIGGTHFIAIDADEAFTANCADQNLLRRMILTLLPGETLAVNMIHVWRSVRHYRHDSSRWSWCYFAVAFCDDGECQHKSAYVHTPRVPSDLKGTCHRLSGYTYGLIHFQFVNWDNLLVKQAWYRCLERVRDPGKPTAAINERYGSTKDERDILLREVPEQWLRGYPFFEPQAFAELDSWRERQVFAWFKEYGAEYFAELDIWDLDWSSSPVKQKAPKAAPLPVVADDRPTLAKHVSEAEEAKQAGDLGRALTAVMKALDYAPTTVELLLAAAGFELAGNLPFAARWHASLAAILAPTNFAAWLRLADAALRTNCVAQARTAANRARSLAPPNAAVYRCLGDVEATEQRFGTAVSYYRQALRLDPDDPEILMRVGFGCFGAGDAEGAANAYRQVLARHPNHQAARQNLAHIQATFGCDGARPPAAAAR